MRLHQSIKSVILSLLLVVGLSVCIAPSGTHAGMGLDFGGIGGGGEETQDESCVPDTGMVITPGPMGSPVRILNYDATSLIVADYTRFTINKLLKDDLTSPEKIFDTRLKYKKRKRTPKTNRGKPLSIAVRPWRSWGAVYYVGNDDRKTIDLFWARKGKVRLFKRLFKKSKVQALDMEYAKSTGKIYMVDGLHKEVKVLDYRGRVRRKIGGFGELTSPKGIAYDAQNREILVSDYGDPAVGIPASIEIFSAWGKHLKTITGAFSRPQGIDVAGGKIYMVDAMLGQVLEIDRGSGQMLATHGCLGTSDGHLLLPMDVVLDEATQTLYVADNRNGRVTALPLAPQQ